MSDRVELVLPDRMDVASAEQLHVTLEAALEEGNPIELNGEKVVRLDTAGVQLVVSFIAAAEMQHIDVAWKAPSSTLFEVFEFMKLGNAVGLEQVVEV